MTKHPLWCVNGRSIETQANEMSIKHEMQDQKARQRNKDGMSPGRKLSKARNRKRRISREDRGERDLDDAAFNEVFSGTTMAYVINSSERVALMCDYSMMWGIGEPELVRGYRECQKKEGKKRRALSEDSLRDEVFVIPGPKMSPAQLVRALREFADVIEATGLQTGRNEHGDYVIERIGTKPRLLLT